MMLNEGMRAGSLLVELYIKGGHVNGVTTQVEGRRRLVDVLNGPESMIELSDAKLTLATNGMARFFRSLSIAKSAMLAAIPHETQEQMRQRAMLNTGLGRSTTLEAQLGLLVPPLYVEGSAHLAPGAGKLRADLKTFTPFFALTSASLYLPEGDVVEADVILLARDAVVSTSVISEPSMTGFGAARTSF
jgi:hypothetical protein